MGNFTWDFILPIGVLIGLMLGLIAPQWPTLVILICLGIAFRLMWVVLFMTDAK